MTGVDWLISNCILLIIGCLLLFSVARLVFSQSNMAVIERFGVDGRVVYADKGKSSRVFISKRYGVKAKPDFIIKDRGGRYTLIEYKSRSSGLLFESDIVQVKASVIAARTIYNIRKAVVISGTTKHDIDVDRSSVSINKEIATHIENARQSEMGVIVMKYAERESACSSCRNKSECLR